jgi:hypothetical protein
MQISRALVVCKNYCPSFILATGALFISGEDTLNAGEISRDLVADVCVASLTDAKASNKVLEIIEDEGIPPQVFNGLKM